MPWTIILEDENGEAIKTCLYDLDYNELSGADLSKYQLLKYLLPWGDTTFNEAQINDLISDLDALKKISAQKAAIESIILLASECLNISHSYLKFYGD